MIRRHPIKKMTTQCQCQIKANIQIRLRLSWLYGTLNSKWNWTLSNKVNDSVSIHSVVIRFLWSVLLILLFHYSRITEVCQQTWKEKAKTRHYEYHYGGLKPWAQLFSGNWFSHLKCWLNVNRHFWSKILASVKIIPTYMNHHVLCPDKTLTKD